MPPLDEMKASYLGVRQCDACVAIIATMKSIKSIMKDQDMHLVVNGALRKATLFNAKGEKQWTIAAGTDGQHSNWREPMGDTPPGLYKVGVIYDTKGERAYGRWCLDLIDLDGQESGNGRAGISLHGGGSVCKDPFAPWQGLPPTHGCVRVNNYDLENRVEPVARRCAAAGFTLYVTVIL